jgi:hypothetical protein
MNIRITMIFRQRKEKNFNFISLFAGAQAAWLCLSNLTLPDFNFLGGYLFETSLGR